MKPLNGNKGVSRLTGDAAGHMLVDLGTSSLTAPRVRVLDDDAPDRVAHPVYETLALSASDCAALGSDFQRTGFLYPRPVLDGEETFQDALGVRWLWADGFPAQFEHPLERASWAEIARHPRPKTAPPLQVAVSGAGLIVADAPCPGLLDTCFALRNGWKFLDDVTGNWQIASALLDWALDYVAESYERMLAALPVAPDVVIYGDDLGFQGGMYLSDTDFRNFLHPRLKTLISRIRAATGAAICLHSCGGVRPILRDLADLGVEILNLDFYAKGMEIAAIRKDLPRDTILHGPVDLGSLGAAALRHERGAVARYALDLAQAGAAIAAPPDNISTRAFLEDCVAGGGVVRCLTPDDLKVLKVTGPTKSIVAKMIEAAAAARLPELCGPNFGIASVIRAHPPSGHAGGASQSQSKPRQGA